MGGELARKHHDELEVLSSTADAAEIDSTELGQWLGAIEVLRLMLGTSLDVSEELEEVPESDPRSVAGLGVPVPELVAGRGHRSPRNLASLRRARE